MAQQQKTGYFKASMEEFRKVAKEFQSFHHLAAYLVMVRHGNGRPPEGIEPFTHTGAGAKSIMTKVMVAHPTAKNILDDLLHKGFLTPMPKALVHHIHSRYILPHGRSYKQKNPVLDVDLSNALVDGIDAGTHHVDSAIKRIKEFNFPPKGDIPIDGVANETQQLDALMLLLELCNITDMAKWGGVDLSKGVWNKWGKPNKTCRDRKEGYFTWLATPENKVARTSIMTASLAHAGKRTEEREKDLNRRFWQALQALETKGLIYEAVSLVDADPDQDQNAKHLVTLRINDRHADKNDPSLMQALTEKYSTEHSFYSTPNSPSHEGNGDTLRIMLPTERGFIVGIYRPRFRASNISTGEWIEREQKAVNGYITSLGNLPPTTPERNSDEPF